MSPNPNPASVAPQNPSAPGTAEWMYNEIMREIEPDLLTTELPKHLEKYARETQAQREERMKAYEQAFAIFDTVAAACEQEMRHGVEELRKQAHAKAVSEEGRERAEELRTIEQEMDATGRNDQ